MKKLIAISAPFFFVSVVSANTIIHDLSVSDFSQDWTNVGLLTTTDDWSSVNSIMGYRGDDMVSGTGIDPQTVLAEGGNVIDVNVNQSTPNTFATGGVAEFELANPTVALAGSGTADAPHLVFYMNTLGRTNVRFTYDLRDLESGGDNAVQAVALQYRIGSTGDFTNFAAAFIADATQGPNIAGPDWNVSATSGLWDNHAELQFRILTTNAAGNDEWVGIDNISITSDAVPEPATMTILAGAAALAAMRRRRK